jgi:radical SAM superfamily enzyme YgiQ (UPF0313 family)
MNILIVETVWMGGARYKLLDKLLLTAFSILPTLQARELAAITPKQHTVTVVNERYTPVDVNAVYDIVLINFVTSTAPRAYQIADHFQKKGIPVVLSGLHASALPDEAKQHADSVLLGRAEPSWLQLLKDAEQKKIQPFYQPLPYDSSVPIPPAQANLPGFVITGAIEATRGCPYQCDFCPETAIPGNARFYKRPVEDVIAEIKALPQKSFVFYDASLTIDPTYTKTLFQKMKGIHKRFFCNGNVDILARDPELVRLSKEAGCAGWLIGFESVSQNTLDAVGKKTNKITEYETAVRTIHTNKMIVIGCFIFGFDTDTPAVFDETLQVIKTLNIDVPDFSILTPSPGTPIYHQFEKEGRLLSKDWPHYNLKTVVFTPKQMTPEELQRGVQRMYQECYTLPVTIRRVVRSLRLGIYPFMVVLTRSMVSMMNNRRLFTQQPNAVKKD